MQVIPEYQETHVTSIADNIQIVRTNCQVTCEQLTLSRVLFTTGWRCTDVLCTLF